MAVSAAPAVRSRTWLTKVPAITVTFWVIKVLSTTIGETFADYLSVNVGLGPAVTDALMIAVLVCALIIQLRTRQYTPWIYWLCVVLVSIVGTQITDFFTDTLGVSLYLSTARNGRWRSPRSTRRAGRASTGPRSSPPSHWARPVGTWPPRRSAWASATAC